MSEISRMVPGKEYWQLSCNIKQNLFTSQLPSSKPLDCEFYRAENMIPILFPSTQHRALHKGILGPGCVEWQKGAACLLVRDSAYQVALLALIGEDGTGQGEGPHGEGLINGGGLNKS